MNDCIPSIIANNMISIEKAREILGDKAKNMSDKELEQLRNDLYRMVGLALDHYIDSDVRMEPGKPLD